MKTIGLRRVRTGNQGSINADPRNDIAERDALKTRNPEAVEAIAELDREIKDKSKEYKRKEWREQVDKNASVEKM